MIHIELNNFRDTLNGYTVNFHDHTIYFEYKEVLSDNFTGKSTELIVSAVVRNAGIKTELCHFYDICKMSLIEKLKFLYTQIIFAAVKVDEELLTATFPDLNIGEWLYYACFSFGANIDEFCEYNEDDTGLIYYDIYWADGFLVPRISEDIDGNYCKYYLARSANLISSKVTKETYSNKNHSLVKSETFYFYGKEKNNVPFFLKDFLYL